MEMFFLFFRYPYRGMEDVPENIVEQIALLTSEECSSSTLKNGSLVALENFVNVFTTELARISNHSGIVDTLLSEMENYVSQLETRVLLVFD